MKQLSITTFLAILMLLAFVVPASAHCRLFHCWRNHHCCCASSASGETADGDGSSKKPESTGRSELDEDSPSTGDGGSGSKQPTASKAKCTTQLSMKLIQLQTDVNAQYDRWVGGPSPATGDTPEEAIIGVSIGLTAINKKMTAELERMTKDKKGIKEDLENVKERLGEVTTRLNEVTKNEQMFTEWLTRIDKEVKENNANTMNKLEGLDKKSDAIMKKLGITIP